MKYFKNVFSFDLLSKSLIGIVSLALLRVVPTEQYASYTLIIAFLTIATQSVGGTINRIYQAISNERLLDSGGDFIIGIIVMIMVLIFTVFSAPFILPSGLDFSLVVILALFATLYDFVRARLQKKLDFSKYSMMEVFRVLIYASLVFVCFILSIESLFPFVVYSQVISYLIVLIIYKFLFFGCSSNQNLRLYKLPEMLKLLFFSGYRFYLSLYFILSGFLSQVDIFMLSYFGDELMLATYGAAFRYYGLLALAVSTLHVIMLPAVHELKSNDEIVNLFTQHFRLSIYFAIIVIIVASLSGFFIPLVDGGRYPESISVFRILCATIIFSFIFSPYVNLIIKHGAYIYLVKVVLIAFLISMLGCFYLIPLYGPTGAAVVTLIASFFVNISVYKYSVFNLGFKLNFNFWR